MGYFTNEIQQDISDNNNSLKFVIEEIENELKNDKITFLFQTKIKTTNKNDSTIELNGNVYPLYCLKGKELVKIPFGWLKVDTLFLATWSRGGQYWLVKTMGTIGSGGSSGVTSFNSRTGAVMPQSGDYAINDITDLANTLTFKVDRGKVLEIDNTLSYTPSDEYHPATKKYVDDNTTTKKKLTSFTLDNTLVTPLTVSTLQNKLAHECAKFNINQTAYFSACVFDIYVNDELKEENLKIADINILVSFINTHNPNPTMEKNLIIISLLIDEIDKSFSGIRGINAGFSLLKGKYGYSNTNIKNAGMGQLWSDNNRNTNVTNLCKDVLTEFYGNYTLTDLEVKRCIWFPNGKQNLYNLTPVTNPSNMSITTTTNSNVTPSNGRLCLNLTVNPATSQLPQYTSWGYNYSLVYDVRENSYNMVWDTPEVSDFINSASMVRFYRAKNGTTQGAVYVKPLGMDLFYIDTIPHNLPNPKFFGLFEGVDCEPFIANLNITLFDDFRKNVGGMFRKSDFIRNMLSSRGDVATIHKDSTRTMQVLCFSNDKIYLINRKIKIQTKRSGTKYKLMVV